MLGILRVSHFNGFLRAHVQRDGNDRQDADIPVNIFIGEYFSTVLYIMLLLLHIEGLCNVPHTPLSQRDVVVAEE